MPGKTEAMVAGYVMAGGASSRFGQDKALVTVGGRPMLARMLELVQGVTKKSSIVGPLKKYAEFGFEVITDQWPGEGPLGGIITALEHSRVRNETLQCNLIVSCDMPFLTREWLTYLVERAAKSAAQVVLPRSNSGPEPLCACYRTDAGPILRAAFERGVRKITDALKHVKTEMLDEAAWKRFDSAERLFWNMNTAVDFEEVRRALEAERA